MSVPAWEDDNSILHARRRALVGARAVKPDRLAVLLVDRPEQTAALKHALAGQPVELETTSDPAVGLFLLGRTCPDVAVVGPTSASLDTRNFLEVVSAHEPELPVIVGVGADDGDLAGHAAGLGAAVLAHPYQPEKLMRLLHSLAPAQDASRSGRSPSTSAGCVSTEHRRRSGSTVWPARSPCGSTSCSGTSPNVPERSSPDAS